MGTLEYVFVLIRVMNNDGDEGDLNYKCYIVPANEIGSSSQLSSYRAVRAGNLSHAMGTRKQVGIGLSYRPACLCSLAQFQTRFLESIPRPVAGLKIPTQYRTPSQASITI
jgi:hypothetical protein